MINNNFDSWKIIGRLINELRRNNTSYRQTTSLPKVGSLVLEISHSWKYRGERFPQPSSVGFVQKIEPENISNPLTEINSRVIIKRLDDETLQPWVNAEFIEIPISILGDK